MADDATSVSKGVFAFKGKSKRLNESDYLQDTAPGGEGRLGLYHDLWEDLHTQIEMLRSDMNCQIFNDLLKFVSDCHRDRQDRSDLGEIPAAVLVTGVNTPDHDVMFANLEEMLKSQMGALVARVGCYDNGKVNMLLSDVVGQLMNVSAPPEENDEMDQSTDLGTGKSADQASSPFKMKGNSKLKRKTLNLMMLTKWYKRTYLDIKSEFRSPRKKLLEKVSIMNAILTTEKSDNPPLVIVFEDVENVNPVVFQDFISLCSTYLPSLPIVLILGIATAVTAIHQVLPSAITALICMETFQAPPASQYLQHILEKTVMTPDVAFKLGPRVFHFLLDNFLYHDFSILNFVLGLQFCMTQHFLHNPLSVLCSAPDRVGEIQARLTKADLAQIRRTDSFQRFVKSRLQDPQRMEGFKTDAMTKKYLQTSMQSLHQHHKNMFQGLHFLHGLSGLLPKRPLGRHFRELYSLCLTCDLCESDSFKQTVTFLRLMSFDDLSKSLTAAVEAVQEGRTEEVEALVEEVKGFIYRLEHLDQEVVDEQQEDTAASERILPSRAKLHELKDHLAALSSKRRRSPYEKLREEVMSSLISHLKKLIHCPLTLQLHEAVYFTDLNAVREHLKAAPRSSTQRALTFPSRYLKCSCCEGDEHAILPSMPDICIVYKLHLECGSLVNLYDWLQAFVTVLTADTKQKKKSTQPSTEHKARFIRAVSELQFLGFIKSTKRKTDHVTRLTW